jgi:hypothetical protein
MTAHAMLKLDGQFRVLDIRSDAAHSGQVETQKQWHY